MLSRIERRLLARVLRHVRTEQHWERDAYPGTYRTRDGRLSVTWDAASGLLQARVKERRAWQDVATAWPATLHQAIDILAALELVPAEYSTCYERGWYIGRALMALERKAPAPACEAA